MADYSLVEPPCGSPFKTRRVRTGDICPRRLLGKRCLRYSPCRKCDGCDLLLLLGADHLRLWREPDGRLLIAYFPYSLPTPDEWGWKFVDYLAWQSDLKIDIFPAAYSEYGFGTLAVHIRPSQFIGGLRDWRSASPEELARLPLPRSVAP